MSGSIENLRSGVAGFLREGAPRLEQLHSMAVDALAALPLSDPDAASVHRVYGALTDFAAKLMSLAELHEELRALVSTRTMPWDAAAPVQVVTGSSVTEVSDIKSFPRLLRFFDTPREAVSG